MRFLLFSLAAGALAFAALTLAPASDAETVCYGGEDGAPVKCVTFPDPTPPPAPVDPCLIDPLKCAPVPSPTPTPVPLICVKLPPLGPIVCIPAE